MSKKAHIKVGPKTRFSALDAKLDGAPSLWKFWRDELRAASRARHTARALAVMREQQEIARQRHEAAKRLTFVPDEPTLIRWSDASDYTVWAPRQ
jgi:hypothetical protein